ncbi:MAG: carboxymuconolactone decarboxylase family protein, partial [Alphaproteobacteria bacterium]
NIYTNYFNHVARTDIDFPRVSAGEAEAATAA